MAKHKNNPRIKSKTVEVSARSWFGKSQMDKTIEKYTHAGWTLVHQTKIRNQNRYTLRFEYELSDAEFAEVQRRQRNANLGFVILMFACAIFVWFSGGQEQRERSSERTQQAIANTTRVAQVAATSNAVATNDAYATATLWTATSTFTPTSTPTASDTPTITNTPTITFTPSITPTPTFTNTPRPSNTPRQTTRTYYITGNTVNARSCPQTNCEVVTVLSRGDELQVTETVTGTNVSGSTDWYHARYNGQDIYVHSSLASRTRPSTSAPAATRPPQTGNTGDGQPAVQPTAIPPLPPTENVSVAPVAASFTCNCSKTCEQMASCEEAYFQLNQCGCSRRDGDNDGVPCEEICG